MHSETKSKFRNTVIRAVVAVVILFALISILLFYYQSIRNFFKFDEIDFTSYIRASGWFFGGENPYQAVPRRFIYPLFLLLVVYPLTFLQKGQVLSGISIGLWSAGLYVAFFATLGAAWKYLYRYTSKLSALRKNLFWIALMVLMLHPFLQDEFLNGQVNLYVLGATAAFFFYITRQKPFPAALMLTIAVSIKISPAICLLFLFFDRQYRIFLYFLALVILFNIALPYLINGAGLGYYKFVFDEVLPKVTGSDFRWGFKQFSILSTFSYLFKIHWNPYIKIAVLGILTLGMFWPILKYAPRPYHNATPFQKFYTFAALISIIPLVFPMSEPHHLLLQTIPILAILSYWNYVYEGELGFWHDCLSLLFLISVIGFHIGHGLKDTPIRLLSLLGVYIGMIWLLKKEYTRALKIT